jgi:hypothetical protein
MEQIPFESGSGFLFPTLIRIRDPTFHCNADPDPAPHQKWCQSSSNDLQTLHSSILNLKKPSFDFHANLVLDFHSNADQDSAS